MDETTSTEPGSAPATSRPAPPAAAAEPMMGEELRGQVLTRLSKAAGQIHGVSRMVTQDRYCVDVLTQISAVQAALDRVAEMVTRNYLERCATRAIEQNDPLIYDEMMRVLVRRR